MFGITTRATACTFILSWICFVLFHLFRPNLFFNYFFVTRVVVCFVVIPR